MDFSPIRLQLRTRTVYGDEYVPANDAAELACALAGTRRMTKRTIAVLREYNIHIVVEGIEEKVL